MSDEEIIIGSHSASQYDASTTPAKPFYGMIDNRAQMIIPRSKNPPTAPILGSVYQDEDDGRIYVWSGEPVGWRASAVVSLSGPGIDVVFDEVTQRSTISVALPEKITLTITGDWMASTPTPVGWRTAAHLVNLQGVVTSSKPLSGSTLTTLPAGWRPEDDVMLSCAAGSSQANVAVYSDGRIVVVNGSGQPLRLGSICFVATPVTVQTLPALPEGE